MSELIPLAEQSTEKIAEINLNREVAARAAATPLPGPLRDAFALEPDIIIGDYSVRAFCEGDFEFLQALEHPLYEILITMLSGKENKSDYFPRGQLAWELCYIFTHPFDEVDVLFSTGKQAVKDAAKKEFSKLPLSAVLVLHKAILKQVMAASSTAVSYAAADEDSGSKKNAGNGSRQ